MQDPWWREPESLFPYIILVDGYPARFNLVAARSRLPDGIEADFMVHEFFVLHGYRGKGVAERAAIEGFNTQGQVGDRDVAHPCESHRVLAKSGQ